MYYTILWLDKEMHVDNGTIFVCPHVYYEIKYDMR